MRVAFVASDNGGGGHVRSHWPAAHLRAHGHHAVASTGYPTPGTVDVLVVHRPLDPDKCDAIAAHQAAGAVVLVDEDDLVHDVPAKFGFRPSDAAKARHLAAIEAADGLIVTTAALAGHYGPRARRTWVVPNRLPASVAQARYYRSRHDTAIRVGWAGICWTHREDLEWLAPHANRAFAGAVFSTIGDHATPAVLRLSGQPTEVFPFQQDLGALHQLMARADIGIVPLAPSPFTRAKSWLKALEYMTLGKPVVAIRLPEQARLITHGVDGFLADTPADFADHVQVLIHDPDLRQRVGHAARATAAHHSLDHASDWAQLIQEATAMVDA
ncbi:MAG: glycosyltransferase [Acidimicrobiales bacterium]